jgi:proteasome lid subunit RPN8/RPN11
MTDNPWFDDQGRLDPEGRLLGRIQEDKMIEAGMVLDKHGMPFFYHAPPGRTSGSLPDSRTLWELLWTNRKDISGFAHSHPGKGYPRPSHTDRTTFAAIDAALGMKLDWWILSEDKVSLVCFTNYSYEVYQTLDMPTDAFPWVRALRRLSQMEEFDAERDGQSNR